MSAALSHSPVPRGRLLGIASGKGGVGKTWFAVTLAHALARTGRRVLLADGDLGLANVDVQIGLSASCDLDAVLVGRATLAQAAQRHPAGFHVLPGRSGSGAMAHAALAWSERLTALLRGATAEWDDVLLDIGAGLDPAARGLAAACDTLLVVATDEPTSLTDAYAVLKLHGRDAPGRDARVVVNMAADPAAGARTHATLARACTNFLGREVPLAGVIRRDAKVRDAIRRQTPLLTRHPNAPAAEDVETLCRGLLG
ncbi:cellulose synthase operon protein YhjQ/BcsQ [Roseomonas sp. BN140053]|uniref:nucleotide-binding protein n=1 Tax=Roseomonas sp. BN140053 TaxID=3391898 RepID=UPI0039EB3485